MNLTTPDKETIKRKRLQQAQKYLRVGILDEDYLDNAVDALNYHYARGGDERAPVMDAQERGRMVYVAIHAGARFEITPDTHAWLQKKIERAVNWKPKEDRMKAMELKPRGDKRTNQERQEEAEKRIREIYLKMYDEERHRLSIREIAKRARAHQETVRKVLVRLGLIKVKS